MKPSPEEFTDLPRVSHKVFNQCFPKILSVTRGLSGKAPFSFQFRQPKRIPCKIINKKRIISLLCFRRSIFLLKEILFYLSVLLRLERS